MLRPAEGGGTKRHRSLCSAPQLERHPDGHKRAAYPGQSPASCICNVSAAPMGVHHAPAPPHAIQKPGRTLRVCRPHSLEDPGGRTLAGPPLMWTIELRIRIPASRGSGLTVTALVTEPVRKVVASTNLDWSYPRVWAAPYDRTRFLGHRWVSLGTPVAKQASRIRRRAKASRRIGGSG